MPEPILFLSDTRGVYIPRDFALSVKRDHVTGVDSAEWDRLAQGPDTAWHWETWDNVLNNATVTDDAGVKYRLFQDGDLWLIPEGMEWSDKEEFFVWPEPQRDEG